LFSASLDKGNPVPPRQEQATNSLSGWPAAVQERYPFFPTHCRQSRGSIIHGQQFGLSASFMIDHD
jgi:hypothetical protein